MDYVSAYYPANYIPNSHNDVVLGAGSTYLQHPANAALWQPLVQQYHRHVHTSAGQQHLLTPNDKRRLLQAAVDQQWHTLIQQQQHVPHRVFLQWDEETQRFYRVNHNHTLVQQGLMQMAELLIGSGLNNNTAESMMTATATQHQDNYSQQQQQQQQSRNAYGMIQQQPQQQQPQQQAAAAVTATTEETWQPYMYHDHPVTTTTTAAAATNDTTLMHPSPIRNPNTSPPGLHATLQMAVERASLEQEQQEQQQQQQQQQQKRQNSAAVAASIANGQVPPQQTQQAPAKKKRGRPRKTANTANNNNNTRAPSAAAVAMAATIAQTQPSPAQVATTTTNHNPNGTQEEPPDASASAKKPSSKTTTTTSTSHTKAVLLEEHCPPPEKLKDYDEWPSGWVQRTYQRQSGNSKGSNDRYWLSPGGKKFRSMVQVRTFLDLLDDYHGNEDAAFKAFKQEHKLPTAGKTNREEKKKEAAASSATTPPPPRSPSQLALQKSLSSKFPTLEAVEHEIARLEQQAVAAAAAHGAQSPSRDSNNLPVLKQLLEIYAHGGDAEAGSSDDESPAPPPPPKASLEELTTLQTEFNNDKEEVRLELQRLQELVEKTAEEDDVEQWEDAMAAGQRLPKLRQLYEEWDAVLANKNKKKRAPSSRSPKIPSDKSRAIWDAMYEQLVDFQRRNGHTRVQYSKKAGDEGFDADEKKFSNWVSNQRYLLNKRRREEGDSMPEVFLERIQRLDAIGFDWPSEEKVAAGLKSKETRAKAAAEAGLKNNKSTTATTTTTPSKRKPNENKSNKDNNKPQQMPAVPPKQPSQPVAGQPPQPVAVPPTQPPQPVAGQPPQPVVGQPTMPPYTAGMFGQFPPVTFGMFAATAATPGAAPPGMSPAYNQWHMVPTMGPPGMMGASSASHIMDAQQHMAHRQGLPNPHPAHWAAGAAQGGDESSEEEEEPEDKLQTLADQFKDRAELDAEIARVKDVIELGLKSDDTQLIEEGVEGEAMLPLLQQLLTWDKFDASLNNVVDDDNDKPKTNGNMYDDDIDEDLAEQFGNREELEEEIERLECLIDEAIVTDNDPKLLEEATDAEAMLPKIKALLQLDKFDAKPAALKRNHKAATPTRTSARVKLEDPGEEGDETFEAPEFEEEDDDEDLEDDDYDEEPKRRKKRRRRIKREDSV